MQTLCVCVKGCATQARHEDDGAGQGQCPPGKHRFARRFAFLGRKAHSYWIHSGSAMVRFHLHAVRREVLAGITTGIAQVPEAVAFAFAAGVGPLVGLHATWILAMFMALFGSRPGQVNGAAGSLAVVIVAVSQAHGTGHLLYTTILSGIFMVVLGLVQAPRLLHLLPSSCMMGFCNGLAILIGASQLRSFHVMAPASEAAGQGRLLEISTFFHTSEGETWVMGANAAWMVLHVVLTMAVVHLLPRLSKAIPSSLVAVALCVALEHGVVRPLGFHTKSIGDVAVVSGSLPVPIWVDDSVSLPPVNAATLAAITPTAIMLAVIGTIESLMTKVMLDEQMGPVASNARECIALGLGNILCGVFGSMGGCALIGTTVINQKSGGVGRLSSFSAGATVLVIILAGYKAINLVPSASLAGVMFMVTIHTFAWESFGILTSTLFRWPAKRVVPLWDAAAVLLVTIVTLFTNLAIGIGCGIVWSLVSFAVSQSQSLSVDAGVKGNPRVPLVQVEAEGSAVGSPGAGEAEPRGSPTALTGPAGTPAPPPEVSAQRGNGTPPSSAVMPLHEGAGSRSGPSATSADLSDDPATASSTPLWDGLDSAFGVVALVPSGALGPGSACGTCGSVVNGASGEATPPDPAAARVGAPDPGPAMAAVLAPASASAPAPPPSPSPPPTPTPPSTVASAPAPVATELTVRGPLFFGTVGQLLKSASQGSGAPTRLTCDFTQGSVVDMSAMLGLEKLAQGLVSTGGSLTLTGLAPRTRALLAAGQGLMPNVRLEGEGRA